MKKSAFIVGASFAAIGVASPGIAQVAEPSGQDVVRNDNVIIVTGLKRDQDLQDVNVAATVIDGDSLADLGVERFDDLQTVAPSLSITDSGLTQSVNIRGIGLASGSPNAANGVATYVDGVFQPPIVSTNSFYDIASIEVLRGPQGTFVGSNSTGGAIFINSRAPELGAVNGYVQGEVGNYERRGLEGAVNLPVSSTLAVRAAGIFRDRGSFYTTPIDSEPGKLHEYGARLGVYWEPSASFNALIRAEFADKKTGGYAYRPTLGTFYEDARTSDIRRLDYNSPTQNDETNEQVTARLEYYTGGGTTFRVIGGYQDKQINNFYDQDATSDALNEQSQYVREEVYTAELNILSDDSKRLSWIAGGYYQRNEILIDITNNPNGFPVDVDGTNRKITTGLFAQVTYDLTDTLSVDLGGRYSTYDVTGDGAVRLRLVGPPPGVQVGSLAGDYDDDQFTGKLALNFEPNPDHLFYAFVAKGYKSGGFASPTTSFDPEVIWDYEIGWKGSLGPVKAQLGAFYYDYSDFQLDITLPETGRSSLINLTDATVKGIEGQVQVRSGGFDLSGGFAYTDSSLSGADILDIRSFADANPGVNNLPQCGPSEDPGDPPTCADYSPFILTTDGGPTLYSPELTFNATAAYTFYADEIAITPRVTYTHLGSRFAYIAYDPVRDKLPAFDLVNASISFEYDDIKLDFFATNIFNEEYSTGQRDNNEFYGAPREYGMRARFDF